METKNKHINLLVGKKLIWIPALIVALIPLILYLPALRNSFVYWDDHFYVYENQNIKSINIDFLRWVTTAVVASLWHPLTIFSLALDYSIWGLNPFGYHLTNILFHAANTFLVFILVARLIECGLTQNSKLVTRNFYLIAASVTALLFGIHPLRVESVVWVSERKDILSAFFFLLSILSYLRYIGNPKKRMFYTASFISFALALMSKPTAVSLPIVLLIIDFYPLKRLPTGFSRILAEKLPFFILSILAALVTIWASGEALSVALPLTTRVIIAINAWVFYLCKIILPFNLAPYYPHPLRINPLSLNYIAAAFIFSTIALLSLRSRKSDRLLFGVWLYYTVTLIPVLGILQVGSQAAADRYTYLPSIGLFILAGLAVPAIFNTDSKNKYSLAIIGALILISALLCLKTIRQTAIWKDSITLWSHEIKMFPNVDLAYYNRGNVYSALGNYGLSIKDFNRAIELNPKKSMAYNNRGNAYYVLNNLDQALIDFKKAVELDQKNAEAFYNLGLTHSRLGNMEEALINYKKAAALGLKDSP